MWRILLRKEIEIYQAKIKEATVFLSFFGKGQESPRVVFLTLQFQLTREHTSEQTCETLDPSCLLLCTTGPPYTTYMFSLFALGDHSTFSGRLPGIINVGSIAIRARHGCRVDFVRWANQSGCAWFNALFY